MKKKESIEEAQKIVHDSQQIVFFGGAGVSTESGIPDFRSAKGIYQQDYHYPPETVLSASFFQSKPEFFFDFYVERIVEPALGAKPNRTHQALVQLECSGKLISVITQNIDDLHQQAGSTKVLELHGSIARNYCVTCAKFFSLEDLVEGWRKVKDSGSNLVPHCNQCEAIIKPDVVLFEEPLDQQVIDQALHDIAKAEVMIVAGTSLVVHPAAGLLRYFQGDSLIYINKDPNSTSSFATHVFHESAGHIMEQLIDD